MGQELDAAPYPAIVEGAIKVAIENTAITIHNATVGVIGHGIVGAALARTLVLRRVRKIALRGARTRHWLRAILHTRLAAWIDYSPKRPSISARSPPQSAGSKALFT